MLAVGWSETSINLYKTVGSRVTKSGLVYSSTREIPYLKCIICTAVCILPELNFVNIKCHINDYMFRPFLFYKAIIRTKVSIKELYKVYEFQRKN